MVIYKSLLVDYSQSACWAWPCLTFDYFSRSVMESRCSRFWMGWSFHGCIHIQNLNWQDDIGQTTIWPISRWLSDSLYCFYMYPPSSADKSSWPLIVSGGESAFGQESALPLPWLLCPGAPPALEGKFLTTGPPGEVSRRGLNLGFKKSKL